MTATARKVRVGEYLINAPAAGSLILTDRTAIGRLLADCETPEFAPFRLHSETLERLNGCYGPACRVEVTGRTFQKIHGYDVVTVRLVFVGDGEPDTVQTGCLMVVEGKTWAGD